MNLKAKIKQLQGVKNVSLQIYFLGGAGSNSWGYRYMHVLPSVGIPSYCDFYVTFSMLLNTMPQNLAVINGNFYFCLSRLMMYRQQQQMAIKRVNRVPRH